MNTSASLRFQVFNFPVRVHISFFLVALLLGFGQGNIINILLWVLIVFFSVLLHELGHAIASRSFGRSPQIELYSMGGLTITSTYSLLSYPKEIFISFAGPLAGFLLGGIVFLLIRVVGPSILQIPYLSFIAGNLLWVNIGWGIVNLIPIIPLDGGSIMRNLYHWLRNPYDERVPLIISIVFGLLAVAASLLILRSLYIALLAAWLTFNNFMALRQGRWTDSFI